MTEDTCTEDTCTEDTCTEDTTCGLAKREFKVIRDLLLVPLKPDSPNEELLKHRKWKGRCLLVELPDLVPVNPFPEEGLRGFCKVKDGKLKVIVKNQGNAVADESTTLIFITKGAEKVFIGKEKAKALNPGESTEVLFGGVDVSKCTERDSCQSFIIVNADFKVTESDVNNNFAIGLCSSPAPTLTPASDRELKETEA